LGLNSQALFFNFKFIFMKNFCVGMVSTFSINTALPQVSHGLDPVTGEVLKALISMIGGVLSAWVLSKVKQRKERRDGKS
jgi:uncharacterized membrane protein YfcA